MKLQLPADDLDLNLEVEIGGQPAFSVPLVDAHLRISLLYEQEKENLRDTKDKALIIRTVLNRVREWIQTEFGVSLDDAKTFLFYTTVQDKFQEVRENFTQGPESLSGMEISEPQVPPVA